MGASSRHVSMALALAATLGITALANAEDAPSPPERLKAAAEEFDRGRRAFLGKDYGRAAVHFENAFRDAPSAPTLRLAIRARREQGELARAATLASIAQDRYGLDGQTQELAKETLDAAAPALQQYDVECASECSVAADGRVASHGDARRHRLFFDPGPHELGVSFKLGGSVSRHVDARATGRETLSFAPAPTPAPTAPARAPAGVGERPPPPSSASGKPLGPVVFFIAAGVTVVAAGATVFSGIDAQNSPGKDAVRRDCAGKDESCETFREGERAETRTNILLGVTLGAAIVTGVVGLFFTRFTASAPPRVREPAVAGVRVGPCGVIGRF